MTTHVYLRVFSLHGLGADYMRRFAKGKVSISAELGNTQASTIQCDFGAGSVKMDQVSSRNVSACSLKLTTIYPAPLRTETNPSLSIIFFLSFSLLARLLGVPLKAY